MLQEEDEIIGMTSVPLKESELAYLELN